MDLSRRQRAAVASVGMTVVTFFSYMALHYGFPGAALASDITSAAMYSVWVYRGNDEGE
jgi:hypothetical protein